MADGNPDVRRGRRKNQLRENRERRERERERAREKEREREQKREQKRARWARYYGVLQRQTLPFFYLPRELRDLVYHWLWRRLRFSIDQNFPQSDFMLYLRYEGHYQVARSTHSWDGLDSISTRLPTAILASKQFLNEAFGQYLRKAEWFCEGSMYSQFLSKIDRLGMTYKMPQDLTAYAGNLSYFEDPTQSRPTGHAHKEELGKLAKALRGLQKGGGDSRIIRLRVFGHTYSLPSSERPQMMAPRDAPHFRVVGPTYSLPSFLRPYVWAPHVICNLWKIFEGIEIPKFEVEVHDRGGWRRQLYNVTGRGEGEMLAWEMMEEEWVMRQVSTGPSTPFE